MVTGTLPIWGTKIVKIVFINNKNEKNLYHTATTKQHKGSNHQSYK